MRRLATLAVAASLAGFGGGLSAAGAQAAQTWPQKKCAFYAKAWGELLALSGRVDVTEAFVSGNEAFIAAGCSNGADVCPGSKGDIELANKLTMAAMNFGTASSFLPFVCRQPQ